MAEYVKFRVSAAKVGVSMALLALIAGIAEKIQAAPAQIRATPAAATNFLKLEGISGSTKSAFIKLELKYTKLQTALGGVENALAHKYLKIKTANAEFLSIADANQKWLKIDDANAEFLRIADANQKFLKLDGTAANSELLGNLRPSDFFQGHGNVVSGAQTIGSGGTQQLVATPDGAISVSVSVIPPGTAAGGPTITIQNNTGQLLPAVQDVSGRTTSADLSPGPNTVKGLPTSGPIQLHLQTFPGNGGGFNSIIAVLVSLEPNPGGSGGYLASGQMLDGGA